MLNTMRHKNAMTDNVNLKTSAIGFRTSGIRLHRSTSP
jgi:hypothetical protein